MIFFTSDSHFNHTNICGPSISKWSGGFRDFTSLDEMNDTFIDNINAVVGPNDTLRHLGDFAFGDRSKIPQLRSRIRCKNIHLILGNHDHNMHRYMDCFRSVITYDEFFYKDILITMMHYPIASWNGIGRGAINLHGHCHGTYAPCGKQLDVGVDNKLNKYKPWSIDMVLDHMSTIPVKQVDHHNEKTNIR